MSKNRPATVDARKLRLYRGGCTCGAVHFEGRLDLARASDARSVWECTVAPESFALLIGDESLAGYQFSRADVHHFFCVRCGVRVFSHHVSANDADFYTVDIRNLHARQTASDGFRHGMLAAIAQSS